jgi:hypothetical protein
VAVHTEREPQTVGELIRFWRTQRRLTQMELALGANLSTKHLSFVATCRGGVQPRFGTREWYPRRFERPARKLSRNSKAAA